MNMLARIVVLGGLGLMVVACTTTQERVGGAGARALAGAAVGGPLGAAVGGVAGAVTGPTVANANGRKQNSRRRRGRGEADPRPRPRYPRCNSRLTCEGAVTATRIFRHL